MEAIITHCAIKNILFELKPLHCIQCALLHTKVCEYFLLENVNTQGAMATTSKGNSSALKIFLGYKVDNFIGYKTFEKDGSKFVNEVWCLGCIQVYFGTKQRKPSITNYTTTSFL